MPILQGLRMSFPAYPLCKLFGYVPSTTTKRSFYTTVALSVAHANPLQADANGLFAEIHLDPDLAYKFVLAPSTDTDPPTNPIFTVENVPASGRVLMDILSMSATGDIETSDGDDILVLADATLGDIVLTPFTAVGTEGKRITVVKVDSTTNSVTIDPVGAQTWGGLSSRVLTSQHEASTGASDGSNWLETNLQTPPENMSDMLAARLFL